MTALRLMRVALVLLRYRLDDLVADVHLFRPLKLLRPFLPRPRRDLVGLSAGARLRLALTDLGPIFVKAGQILSTRRDLIPAELADELALLQDQVPPFPGDEAVARVELSLRASIDELFESFEHEPLASASIAQVHAAVLPDGRDVVIKVLRPGIEKRILRDIGLLQSLGQLAERWHPAADKIRPMDVVEEIEKTLENELDLQREGANASLLRRNFENSPDLYVPAVHWSRSAKQVLCLERVHGVPVDDVDALDEAGIDRKALAAKGVRLFYEQVFRDNFFHADAHPGNIWVDPGRREEPRIIALDFGIMGSLPDADQYWLAENFIALFERDYRRIAELHLAAGWMPRHVRVDELEAAVRTVCEPYFTQPLSKISLAAVVAELFAVGRRFELTLQPQLILLQKTLLNIEGVGRMLDPDIDIWAVAHPVLKKILRQRYSPRAALREMRKRFPEWLHAAPRMPELARECLQQAVAGEIEIHMQSRDLAQIRDQAQRTRHVMSAVILGTGLVLCATLIWLLAQPPRPWLCGALAVAGLVSLLLGMRHGRE